MLIIHTHQFFDPEGFNLLVQNPDISGRHACDDARDARRRHTHVHFCMFTHARVNKSADEQLCAHARARTQTQSRKQARKIAQLQAHTPARKHTRTHAGTHARTGAAYLKEGACIKKSIAETGVKTPTMKLRLFAIGMPSNQISIELREHEKAQPKSM